MSRVDLNCDLGEGAGHDAGLMPLITSANIACGLHAGDAATMGATVALAQRHQVAIGAHPSLDDRENFGRRELPVTPGEAHLLVLTQTRRLQMIARQGGARVGHVKPHGALYNMAARDAVLAQAVANAVYEADPRLVLYGLAGSFLLAAGRACGLRVASEVFADRTYQRDGSLTPRSQPGALIHSEDAAVGQVLRMIQVGTVRATDGTDLPIQPDTVCLHGDGANPVAFAQSLKRELVKAGIEVKAFGP
jgi:5-oxoprolinase (ATP-hydrolysing) subunit A